ncbi:MAG: arginase family protein [Thermoplasmata archaeon]|nr:arginase family protein [Thermoplasmata archaeon]
MSDGRPRSITIIEAPTNLGLSRHKDGRERGCDKLPSALRAVGMYPAIGAGRVVSVTRRPYPAEPTYDEGTLNATALRPFLIDVADQVGATLSEGRFPLVIGGDCSVLIGAALALSRRGRHGLCFLDAHLDYVHTGSSKAGVVAGMDLAIVTGKGTSILADIDRMAPYFHEEDVVALGFRPADAEEKYLEEEFRASRMWGASTADLRRDGLSSILSEASHRLSTAPTLGFWVHVDADVLDSSIMPAVDCPEPGGLVVDELVQTLRQLLSTGKAVGMNVGILDPDLDPSGECVARVADLLEKAVGREGIPVDRSS